MAACTYARLGHGRLSASDGTSDSFGAGMLRVFNMSAALVLWGEGAADVDWSGGWPRGFRGDGYRHAVPEVARYRACEACCCLKGRFLSLEHSPGGAAPPALLLGEADEATDHGRLTRWPLNARTGKDGSILLYGCWPLV